MEIVFPADRTTLALENYFKGDPEHNVYGYYIKNERKVWVLVYIGQTHSKYYLRRMNQHLIKKSHGTFSKLKEFEKQEIGFKAIRIDIQELRHYFEILLIERFKSVKAEHINLSNILQR
jgi:hypothetical protein